MAYAVKEVSLTETGLLPSLIQDYLLNPDKLKHLFNYPFEPDNIQHAIEHRAAKKINRKILVDTLKKQYVKFSNHPEVEKNILLLADDKTFTITAAHQPCLFTGPVFNIFKIAGTVNVCRQLKTAFPAYNFVPVFWLGSEDHDVEELSHAFINGKRIDWEHSDRGASGKWNTKSLESAITELKNQLPGNQIISVFESGLLHHSDFGEYSQYLIHELFKDYGLVVLNQDEPELKANFKEVISDEILNRSATETLNSTIQYLEQHYKAQAVPREINFFYLQENSRERIVYDGETGLFRVNNTMLAFTKEQIISEIELHPERFSPNVITRPLYQEFTLPNLAFVGGSGELSYWLQLKPLFDRFDICYPMLIHRNMGSFVNDSFYRKAEKLGLSLHEVFQPTDQLFNQYVRKSLNADLLTESEEAEISRLFDSIAEKAEKADPTLKNAALAEKQKALTGIQNVKSKVVKAEKKKQETALQQLNAIHAQLFPEETLQERRDNFLSFYREDFIAEMVKHCNPFRKAFLFLSEL